MATAQDNVSGLDEIRIAVRYTTTDIPGPPSERGRRIAVDLAKWKLSRHFRENTDFIHLPTNFDSAERTVAWILCDFNVHKHRSVVDIPIQFYRVRYSSNESPA